MKRLSLIISFLFVANVFADSMLFDEIELDAKNSDEISYYDKEWLTIDSVEIEEIRESINLGDFVTGLGDVVKIVDGLIAIGKSVWPLVEAGKPVVTTNFKSALSVIPNINGGSAFNEITGWSWPVSKKFGINYKNKYGANVVSFTFSVNSQYGGNYEGNGKYLTGVYVVPNDINVMWGYNFDATSSLINITNIGTKENPVAAVTLEVDYTVKTVLKENKVKGQFFITGEGDIVQIN